MAYERQACFDTPLFNWQVLTLQAAEAGWSAAYRVAGPRLLVPSTSSFDCELGAGRLVCDPSCALWLTPDTAYRMRRPHTAQRSHVITTTADLGPARRTPWPVQAHAALAQWQRQWAAGQLEALALEERLAGLLNQVAAAAPTAAPHRAVERACELLAAAPGQQLTLSEIGRAVHCSPFHLARAFRRSTGRSLHAHRMALRLALAVDRLAQGQQDLSALAAELGFASHSHFSTVFRRSLGQSPQQLRTNLAAQRRLQ